MVNYNNGKIYVIRPIIEHDEGDVYVGSTTKKYLSQRMQQHKKEYTNYQSGKPNGRYTVFNIYDKYGINNCDIFLIENVNANSKDELHTREGHHIRNIKCVNKMIAGGCTREEYLQKKKQERERNKERCRLYTLSRLAEKYKCPCGGRYSLDGIHNHKKTKIHLKYLQAINTDDNITIL